MHARIIPLLALVVLAGCESTQTAPFQMSEEEARRIVTSLEATRFQTALDGMKARIDSAEDPAALLDASREELGWILFDDPSGYEAWERELHEARAALWAAHPVLSQVEGAAPECRIDEERFGLYAASLQGGALSPASASSDPTCGSYWQQLKLIGCAGACGVASGGVAVLAGLCGWGCWCMLCNANSKVHDTFCGFVGQT